MKLGAFAVTCFALAAAIAASPVLAATYPDCKAYNPPPELRGKEATGITFVEPSGGEVVFLRIGGKIVCESAQNRVPASERRRAEQEVLSAKGLDEPALAGHDVGACPSTEAVLKQIPLGTDLKTGKSIDSMYHPGVSYVFPSRSLFEDASYNTMIVDSRCPKCGEMAVQRDLGKAYALKPGTCVKILSADDAASIAKVRITSGPLSGKTGYIDLLWAHPKERQSGHKVLAGKIRKPTITEFNIAVKPDCYDFYDACYNPGFDGPDAGACAQYAARCH